MKPNLIVVMAAVLGATSGCASRSFVRADPPASSEGVTVALLGQQCSREGWNEGYDVLDLDVVLRVTNGTAAPIDVVPSEMRLLASGNSPSPRSSSPKWEDAPLQVPPNSSANVRVHFHRRGNARCNQAMQLSLGRSVDKEGRTVMLPPMSFVASREDT